MISLIIEKYIVFCGYLFNFLIFINLFYYLLIFKKVKRDDTHLDMLAEREENKEFEIMQPKK